MRVRVLEGAPPSFAVCGTLSTMFKRGVTHLSVSKISTPAEPSDGTRGEPRFVQIRRSMRLWEIVAPDGNPRVLTRLRYGEVPAGFVQVLPQPETPPPPLDAHSFYEVSVSGRGSGSNTFDYRGRALTAESYRTEGN